tara:strand:+ start:35 stop:514 length:480 start_codon:yes stop_codon:yes gene_type:complete
MPVTKNLSDWFEVRKKIKSNGPNQYLFVRENGESCKYAFIAQRLKRAIVKSGLSWPDKKGIHHFRSIFSTRTKKWAYPIKRYALNRIDSKDMDAAHYESVSYEDIVPYYFEMLREEKNPFYYPKHPFQETNPEDKLVEKLMEKPAFKQMMVEVLNELKN